MHGFLKLKLVMFGSPIVKYSTKNPEKIENFVVCKNCYFVPQYESKMRNTNLRSTHKCSMKNDQFRTKNISLSNSEIAELVTKQTLLVCNVLLSFKQAKDSGLITLL